MSRLILFLFLFAVVCISTFELNRRFQETNYLMLEDAPLNKADTLIAQAKWQEAKLLAQFLQLRPDLDDTKRAQSIEIAADAALDSLPISSQAFINGLISGEADNTSSLLGALTLDLFVLGDIRDLVVQGYKEITDQDGDKIILALSATGLTLSLVPQLHWAPSVMKSLKRSSSFSPAFIKTLKRISAQSIKSGNYKPLAKVVTNFAQTTKYLGFAPTKGIIKAVRSPQDLKRLAGASKLYPKRTYGLTALVGQRGLKLLSKSGGNIAAISQKIKRVSRLAKTSKKTFGVLPKNIILFALIVSLLLMTSMVFWRNKKTA